MDWVVENWDTLLEAAFIALALASVITKMTPTPKDDAVVRRILGFLSFLQPRDQSGLLKRPLKGLPREGE